MTIPKTKYPEDNKTYLDVLQDPVEFLYDKLPLKEKPTDGYLAKPENLVVCPTCAGHGYWNLTLNAYGEGRHFTAQCSNCSGHGYVVAGSKDATCKKHEWSERTIGRCLHEWTCKKCGQKRVVDTSD